VSVKTRWNKGEMWLNASITNESTETLRMNDSVLSTITRAHASHDPISRLSSV